MSFTAIGDTVNTAARLQVLTRSLERRWSSGTLSFERSTPLSPEIAAERLSELEDRGEYTLRGRTSPVRVWTRKGSGSPARRRRSRPVSSTKLPHHDEAADSQRRELICGERIRRARARGFVRARLSLTRQQPDLTTQLRKSVRLIEPRQIASRLFPLRIARRQQQRQLRIGLAQQFRQGDARHFRHGVVENRQVRAAPRHGPPRALFSPKSSRSARARAPATCPRSP